MADFTSITHQLRIDKEKQDRHAEVAERVLQSELGTCGFQSFLYKEICNFHHLLKVIVIGGEAILIGVAQ